MARSREETIRAREEALRLLMGGDDSPSRFYAESQAWQLIDRTGWGFDDRQDTDEELLAALTLVDLVREQVDQAEERLLRALRREEDPVPWPRIAAAMGLTRQGAERRLLRATDPMKRNPESGRQARARLAGEIAERKRRAAARWGRHDGALRDWEVRVRVRRGDGELVGTISGEAGEPPRLTVVRTEDGGLSGLSQVTVLEVLEEITPWEGVDPPADPLAGLTTS